MNGSRSAILFLCLLGSTTATSPQPQPNPPPPPSPSTSPSRPTTFEENILLGWDHIQRLTPNAQFAGLKVHLGIEPDKESEETLEPPPYTKSETAIRFTLPVASHDGNTSPPSSSSVQDAQQPEAKVIYMHEWGDWETDDVVFDDYLSEVSKTAPFIYSIVARILPLTQALRLAYEATLHDESLNFDKAYDWWVRSALTRADLQRRGRWRGRYNGIGLGRGRDIYLPHDVYYSFDTWDGEQDVRILVAVYSKSVFIDRMRRGDQSGSRDQNEIGEMTGPILVPGRDAMPFDPASIAV